jgi:tetratricopeptide (TPR) repeat protein
MSANLENELSLLERYHDDIDATMEQFLDSDPNQRSRVQKQLEQKLGSYKRQIDVLRTNFPGTEEWKSHEATYYVGQATLKAFSVGFFRKSSGRAGNLAVGIATGLVAKQQEKNNAIQALQLLDQAIGLDDSPHPRIMKAQIYRALGQKENALKELNYIISKFQSHKAYVDARQMKDEIENPPKKGMCFVATAAYGSPLAPEVVLLSRFRDDVLLNSTLGRVFVSWYYRVSPRLASLIARVDCLRVLTRHLLAPILRLLKAAKCRS